jgi:YVTN family beta-propeller protein
VAAALISIGIPIGVGAAPPSEPPSEPAELAWQDEHEGIAIEARMEVLEEVEEGSPFQEGRNVRVSFRVTDQATGEAYTGLNPAAWMDLVPKDAPPENDSCKAKAESFLGGSLLSEAEVNLNVYYVLALNDDGTITVVDPLFGFGGTKLLALIELESPGEDWALSPDGGTLYVSMPEVDRVAVVDTAHWKVRASVDVGGAPGEVGLTEDGRRLWVATSKGREGFGEAGISVIETRDLSLVRHLETGPGPQHLAFSDDGRWGIVASGADGTVTVVDVGSMEVAGRVGAGGRAAGVAWSTGAAAAYVSVYEGEIVVIDPERTQRPGVSPVRARIRAEKPGLGRISFAPDGRLGFVVNPREDTVHLIDSARDRIIQTADVEAGPDQVAFSDELAYVRHAGDGVVLMIPLDAVGEEGRPVPVIDFPGGQRPPAEGAATAAADAIVQAPGAAAVLVANPADGVIYYYKEGMAAPMGSFKNYGRTPRAVEVVDRSLQDRGRGVYETTVQLRRAGEYDLVLYLDTPTTVRCFPFQVAENPELRRAEAETRVAIELVGSGLTLETGEPVTVALRVRDSETGAVREDVEDLRALVFLSPGVWQWRGRVERGDDGLWSLTFTPPEDGLYYLYFQSPSVGMGWNRSPAFVLEATSPEAPPVSDVAMR